MFGFLSLNVAVKMKKLCVWRGGGVRMFDLGV